MKLASNVLLVSSLVAIVEAVEFARRSGLDLDQFVDILLTGQMSSDLLRANAPKAVAQDYAPKLQL